MRSRMRSRALFQDSVDGLDLRMRSRLTQARNAALDAAHGSRRPWLFGWKMWAPAAGVTAAAILGLDCGSVRRSAIRPQLWRRMASRISKILTSSRLRTKVRLTPWTCCKTISSFMILRTRPRIRDRPRRLNFAGFGRSWLLFGALCATASATPPPATPTPPAPPPNPPASSAKPPATPDESFHRVFGLGRCG